ncbi:MAG: DNA-directed RNA polymerase subunit omega [Coriobacteriia bacterium]|nr:DNA-directed RNA polymerase subunit omega [Coriobacteriia bacterium]
MSIVNPEIDVLLEKVDSKFTLCTLAAKRACQINDMVHGVREQALSAMATSEIAKLTSAKPLALAMDEIAGGDVSAEEPLPPEVIAAKLAAAEAEKAKEEEAAPKPKRHSLSALLLGDGIELLGEADDIKPPSQPDDLLG